MIKKLPPFSRRLHICALAILFGLGSMEIAIGQSSTSLRNHHSINEINTGQRTPGGQPVSPSGLQELNAESVPSQSIVSTPNGTAYAATRSMGLNYLNLPWTQPVLRHVAQLPYAARRSSWSGAGNSPTAAAGACDTILYEDFQSKVIPATWGNLDLDNNADANGRPLDWYVDFDPQSTTAGDSNWTAHSSSWFTSVAQANNWLILPQIQICDPGVEMIWKSAPNEGPGYLDGYEVLLSTTGNAPANFTTVLATFAEDVSGTGAGTLGAGIAHTSYTGNLGLLEEWSVPLGAYNGQNVYIAFRHTSTDDNLIRLDDIFIGLLANFDLATTAVGSNSEYTVSPVNHVSPINYAGIVENVGASTANAPTLTVDVTTGGSSVFTTNSSIPNLPSGDDTLLTMATAHTPNAVGTYRASFESSLAQGDLNPGNDTLSYEYDVSNVDYARDNGVLVGNLSIGTNSDGVLGQEYDILTNDTLTTVNFYLDAPDQGDTIYAVVYSMGATQPNALLATSNPLIVPTGTGANYSLTFPGGVALTPGAYMIGLLETVGGSLGLGYSADIFTPGRTWVFLNNAWSNSENFNFEPAYMLRPQFGSPSVAGPCSDTLLFEDFQSQTIPATWGNLDLDGATDANARPQDWYVTIDLETTVAGDTNYVAAASSWFTPPGTSNNWLVLPQITICDTNIDLLWKSAPFEGLAFMDGYNVRLSTTGNAPADFTTVLASFAEDTSGTGTPGPGIVHSNFNGNRGVLSQWAADLSAFNGQSVYIAFEHVSNDDNLILLDDIFIGREVGGDVAILEAATSSEYTITPLSQVQSMTFEGRVANNASADVTNILLDLEVLDQGAIQHTDMATLALLGGLSDSLLSLTSPFTPVDTGVHTANFSVSATGVDPDSLNNGFAVDFEISDTVYARDNGISTGALSIGTGSDGILGQEFDIVTATNLTSATFTLTGGDIGDTIEVVLYTMGATSPNAQIASTGQFIVPTAGGATFTVPFPSPVALTPGAYFLGLLETAANATTLSTSDNIFSEDRTWVFFNNAWANSEDFNFEVAYMLRANLSVGCVTPTAAFTSSSTNFMASFTNTSSASGTASYFWDFGDGNTSTTTSPAHTYAANGTYTVCLTVSDSCGTDSSCSSISVNCATPATAFNSSSSNLVAIFADATTGSPSNWLWDFGDGNTSTMQNPTHTYATPGSYTVCLTTINACGADSSCSTVSVSCPAPSSGFNSNVNNLMVTFADATTGNPVSWFWDFGDGNTATVQNPSHSYSLPGSYTVCLTTTNACGSDSSCSSVTVNCAAPVSNWSFTSQGGGLTYSFTDLSTSTGATSYTWTFGDGNTSTQQNPFHTYAVSGSYTVCLSVTDQCASDSMCMPLVVVGVEDPVANAIEVFPNPTQGDLMYNIQLDFPEALELALHNSLGQVVFRKSLGEVSQGQGRLDIGHLAEGLYYLRVKGARTNEVHSVRVAH